MLDKQQQLYQRICDYELDDPGHEFGFLAHLMRANGWSRPFALRAIEEFRKFVFLALMADHPVTPSDQVDQVWHLHLLCSDAYWNDFCPRVLGRPLHHHPAKGGQAERDRFHEQYRATIRSYRQHFGEPPLDLWPPVDGRFGRDLQMQRGPIRRPFRLWSGWRSWRRWRWSMPMGGPMLGLGVIGSALASAAAGVRSDPPPESGDPLVGFLVRSTIYITSLMVGWIVSYRFLRPLLLQPSGLSTTPQLDDEGLAYLSAGPTRVLELGLASLVQQGVLRVDPSTRELVLIGRIDEAMPGVSQRVLTVYGQLAANGSTAVAYTKIVDINRYDFKSLQESLQSQKLLLKGPVKHITEWLVLLLPGLTFLSLFGWLPPDAPLLLVFTVACFLGLGAGIMQPSGCTIWGDAVLHYYKSTSSHAYPLQLIALLGPAAMTDVHLHGLRSLINQVNSGL